MLFNTKKLISYLTASLMLCTALSCATNEASIVQKGIDIESIQEFDALSSFPAKRLAFNVLSAAERHYVMVGSMGELLSNPQMSVEKKVVLQQLINNITPDLYVEENVNKRADFLANYQSQWYAKAKKVFSEEELFRLSYYPFTKYKDKRGFASLDIPVLNVRNDDEDPENPTGGLNCDCHGGDSYDCNTTNGVLKCKDVKCGGRSSFGCGGWGLASCTSVCYRDGKPDQTTPKQE